MSEVFEINAGKSDMLRGQCWLWDADVGAIRNQDQMKTKEEDHRYTEQEGQDQIEIEQHKKGNKIFVKPIFS